MTTYIPFTPSASAPFQTQITLDDQVYNLIVTWNLSSQRFYANLYDLGGNLIFCLPLVGSPTGFAISSLMWAFGVVTAVTQAPHGYNIGQTINLTVSGCSPDAYNGEIQALITGPSSFTYPLATFPGATTAVGNVDQNISLTAGYFSSTLVYRAANQQLEVSP